MRYRILSTEIVSFLFVVVALSMALTPFLAEFGQRLGKSFEKGDMKVGYPLSPLCFALNTSAGSAEALPQPQKASKSKHISFVSCLCRATKAVL